MSTSWNLIPTHRKQCMMLFLEFILQLCYGINGPRFSNVPLSSLWERGWNSPARFHSVWTCHLPLGIETCLCHKYMAVRAEVWSKEIKFWVQLQCIQPYWHLLFSWSVGMNTFVSVLLMFSVFRGWVGIRPIAKCHLLLILHILVSVATLVYVPVSFCKHLTCVS